MMKSVGSILLGSAAGLALVASAHSADLPTTKAPAPPPTVSCFASFYDYISASAQDCPLTYMGITVYGQIDVGAGYNSHASGLNGAWPQGVQEAISKTSLGPKFQLVPGALSESNVGVKGKEEFAPGWSFVFDVNTGFDPYSLQLANGPKSLVENNDRPVTLQSSNGDSSRAGQWDNTRGYLGISNSTFGALTVGRQYSLTNDAVNNYDPMGASYAFSLIGNSSTLVSGVGDTEVARYNTSLKYQIAYNNFRAAADWQFGGYSQGNGSDGAYQFDVGADYAGFSVDAIYSYAKDAVTLSTYAAGSTLPKGWTPDDLKATLADISGAVLAAKYTNGPFKLFGGYENALFTPPSDAYPAGFGTLGDYTVLPGAVSTTTYINHKELQVAWFGAKYAIRPDLDITGAYYWTGQNNYSNYAGLSAAKIAAFCAPNTAKLAGTTIVGQGSANSTCAGTEDAVSALLDWRPLSRLDVYGGVMFSQVAGGLANGFIHTTSIAPTAGLRLTF
jgi:predicted porin